MLLYFLTVFWLILICLTVSYFSDGELYNFFKRIFIKVIGYIFNMEEKMKNIPSIEYQKEILSLKLAKSIVAGEIWYLINSKWMKSLKKYIGILKNNQNQPSGNPGPIDNSTILAINGIDLKKGLAENIDYELVSEECWNLLVEWYGYYRDQQPIHRKAITAGINYTMVEVYLVELHCFSSFDLLKETKITVSKSDMMSHVHNLIREKYLIKSFQNTRLWISSGSGNFNLINLQGTVQEAGLSNSQKIILEVQASAGYWSRNGEDKTIADIDIQPGTSKQTVSQMTAMTLRSSHIFSGQQKAFVKPPGVCGLYNLGNTCFMNSVLQCMSNSSPVTEYFLNGCHLTELNINNPMGMHGEIAKAYGDLIQAIWSGLVPASNPLNFKIQVSKFNPQFCGCQQHDAQELLTFLLDGLHEDLNRITEKPYVPNKDFTGQEDHVFAEETWTNYKLRNDSIIVDTFHGLLKSRVICPQCERLSVAFDPFCSLSMPLPLNKDHQFKVKFIPYNPHKKELFYRIMLPKRSSVKDLCYEMALKTITNASHMVVAEITNSHIHRFFSPEESLELVEDKDIIHIFELNVDPYSNKYFIIPVYFWEKCKPTDNFTYNHLFGVPVLAAFPKASINKETIVRKIFYLMSRHFCYPTESSNSEENGSLSEGAYYHSNLHLPDVYVLDSGMTDDNVLIKLQFDGLEGEIVTPSISELLSINDFEEVFSRKILVVQIVVEEKHKFYSEQAPEYGLDFHSSKLKDRERLVISDCFDLFTTCEKLGMENTWFCPTCKIHQRATKKFDLWKLPKVLIIHLKRFSYTRSGDKIDTFVEYPLTDLRLAKYIINPSQQEITYNLIGVINHHGTMSGGHYTAYCKNKNTGKWYCFDDDSTTLIKEDDVLSPAAYVLFYMRNDDTIYDNALETR